MTIYAKLFVLLISGFRVNLKVSLATISQAPWICFFINNNIIQSENIWPVKLSSIPPAFVASAAVHSMAVIPLLLVNFVCV